MPSDVLSKVKSSIHGLSKRLLSKVKAREDFLLKARKAIRLCGEAISLSHRGHVSEAREKLKEVKELIEELRLRAQDLEFEVFNTLLQEYVEAEALIRIMEGEGIPSIEELQVTDETYVLGLADLIGELRRRVLEEIRRGNSLEAEHLYELMKELYELIWPLEYPKSLVPGLRHKIDVMRRVVDETLHDLTLMKMLSLSRRQPSQ